MFDGVTQKAFYQKISMSVVEPRVKSQEGFPLKLKIQSMHVAASNNDIYIYIYKAYSQMLKTSPPPSYTFLALFQSLFHIFYTTKWIKIKSIRNSEGVVSDLYSF